MVVAGNGGGGVHGGGGGGGVCGDGGGAAGGMGEGPHDTAVSPYAVSTARPVVIGHGADAAHRQRRKSGSLDAEEGVVVVFSKDATFLEADCCRSIRASPRTITSVYTGNDLTGPC